ncbi:MAG: hypothetical protein SFZ02_07090 [bacterium]|nr:hypothetical protein [bacterium]
MNGQWGIFWVIAFLGFPPGGALATLIIGHLNNPLQGILGGFLAGIVIGGAQFLALRGRLAIDAWWIVATAGALAVGVAITVLIFGSETTLEAVVIRAPLTGLLLGMAQFLILRQHVHNAWVWIPVITVVYTLAWYITGVVIKASLDQGFVVFGASGALVYQILTGVTLWWLLRNPIV